MVKKYFEVQIYSKLPRRQNLRDLGFKVKNVVLSKKYYNTFIINVL
jgi:hypothetical protein